MPRCQKEMMAKLRALCDTLSWDVRAGHNGQINSSIGRKKPSHSFLASAKMVRTCRCGFIVGLCLSFLCATANAQEQPTPARQILTAKDFWETTGQKNDHVFDEAVQGELRNIALDEQSKPELRLRAGKLLCDLAGHTRLSTEFPAKHAARAMTAGMKYLEANLADATVRKFAPQLGFTHLAISQKSTDAEGMWFLIESVEPARNGGLNLRVDPTTWKVTQVEHWGKIAPAIALRPTP
jgi:hypothetical protein